VISEVCGALPDHPARPARGRRSAHQLWGAQLTDAQATQIVQAAQLIRSNIAADMS
jgi:hypothetical protein